MKATVSEKSAEGFTVSVFVPFGRSMLDSENKILDAVNAVGVLATQEALKSFDTDGDPIFVAGEKMTTKGLLPKEYQTPYGPIALERHVYQCGGGGKTYCPLEDKGRIIVSSTPRFAKLVSSKYAEFGSGRVCEDLASNRGRTIARSFVQNLADAVASVAQAKEEDWTYAAPKLDSQVATIGVGLDGTCMLMCEDGWRETMVGTLSLYDSAGERLHTTYIAATPEYGKETFLERLETEIHRSKSDYPKAVTVGVADGALGNWEFLNQHTTKQVLDFYHATEYLTKAADAAFKGKPKERENWLTDACHRLKHEKSAPAALIGEFEKFQRKHIGQEEKDSLGRITTYFRNNKRRMVYAQHLQENLPLGSGVTEAACKVIVKQRLCNSGMKWKERGAASVLSLRTLSYTTGRWEQFWGKVSTYGCAHAA